MERHPSISKYHRWGPGYFIWTDKNDDDSRWHGLGWELYKHSYAQSRLGCSLEFSDDTPGEIYCTAYVEGTKVKAREESQSVKALLNSTKTLDQQKLLSFISKAFKQWGLLPKA